MKKIDLIQRLNFAQKVKNEIYYLSINLYIFIVEHLIERNKNYWKTKHSNDLIRLQKSSDRYNKNIFDEQKRLEEKAIKNDEKIFRKYMTLYYFRKSREKEQKLRKSQNHHKLMEKSERLEEIDKKEHLKTKEIIKKLDTIERKKNALLKQKKEELLKFRNKRNQYNIKCQIRKQNMIKELSDVRLDILDYQSCILRRDNEKTKLATLKRNQSTERTLNDQLNLGKNIGTFFKKLETIKSENVLRKTIEDRRKIYLQNKRLEAERRKHEEEEKMIEMNLK